MNDPFPGFKKRTYSLWGFVRESFGMVKHFPRYISLYLLPGWMDSRFREALMLAVTEINDCRYCKFVHSAVGESSGLDMNIKFSSAEIENHTFTREEKEALRFASLWAEQGGFASGEQEKVFLHKFSSSQKKDILSVLTATRISNLCGNTLDALLSRFRGRPRPKEDGGILGEFTIAFFTLILGWPMVFYAAIIRLLLIWKKRNTR